MKLLCGDDRKKCAPLRFGKNERWGVQISESGYAYDSTGRFWERKLNRHLDSIILLAFTFKLSITLMMKRSYMKYPVLI